MFGSTRLTLHRDREVATRTATRIMKKIQGVVEKEFKDETFLRESDIYE
jgi:hypothetical protein